MPSLKGTAPAFAEAASRRQAEAFPRQRTIFVMTGMSPKGSTERVDRVRERKFCNWGIYSMVRASRESLFLGSGDSAG